MQDVLDEGWGEYDVQEVRHLRLLDAAVRDELVAVRRLHPGVGHDDPEGAEVGGEDYDAGGAKPQARAQPVAPEQH